MSENKFIAQLKGNTAPGSVLEVQDKGSKTSFANMPSGTSDAIVTYSDKRNNATAVLKGAMNWKVNGSTLSVANPAGDGSDYTGQTAVAGISDQQGNNLWINASYTVPAGGLFLTKNTKWVLKLCGDNLIVNGGDTAEFTVLITAGNSTIITKKFYVGEQANQFCKELVIDFAESNTSTVKLEQGDTITLKLLSDIPNASARIYQGMTTLTLLQRAVDAENVISNEGSYEDVWEEINKKVNIDGSSIMSGPLKFRAGSMQCAIAPYWDGVGFFKLNSNDSVTLLASMEATDGLCPATNNTYNLGKTNYKWKDAYIGRVITSVLNNGADISVPTTGGTLVLNDFSNITDSAKNIGNWSSNVTNCITEIPQDIKLELNSGTLTLKAGSKVYKPNGSGVFDTIDFSEDKTITNTTNGTYLICATTGGMIQRDISRCVSGATRSLTTTYMLWYDTTNNVVNNYGSDSATPAQTVSLPIAIITVSGGAISSINQVFNGIGYIGSTVFALPGVKGLIPNGRNADGSLKNTNFITSSVIIRTFTSAYSDDYNIFLNNIAFGALKNTYVYDKENNRNKDGSNNYDLTEIGIASITSGQITSFSFKQVFHAVDYSDSDWVAHQAMPSNRYVGLANPTQTTNYTAPADGYVAVAIILQNGASCALFDRHAFMGQVAYGNSANEFHRLFLLVRKGATYTIQLTGTFSINFHRFEYANGAK